MIKRISCFIWLKIPYQIIEVGKEFRIHVAYSNYKFMMSHLDEDSGKRIGNDIDIEVVNDANLGHERLLPLRQAFGVFDCGIDMELNNNLVKDIRLLCS